MSPPKIPIGDFVEGLVKWIDLNFGWLLDMVSGVLDFLVGGFQDVLSAIPAPLLIIAAAVLAWFITRKNLKIGLMTLLGLLLVWDLGLWPEAMETLALVMASSIIVLAAGIPLGILAARSDLINKSLEPALDFMQTMPSFVYLIPAVIFFGLGNVPGIIATVIFAMPPAIRLTNPGIRQTPRA